jgi:hypothetical protein
VQGGPATAAPRQLTRPEVALAVVLGDAEAADGCVCFQAAVSAMLLTLPLVRRLLILRARCATSIQHGANKSDAFGICVQSRGVQYGHCHLVRPEPLIFGAA